MSSNLDRIKKLREMQPIRFDENSSDDAEENEQAARIERLREMQPVRFSDNRPKGDIKANFQNGTILRGADAENGPTITVSESSPLNSKITRFSNALIQSYGSNANLPYRIKNMIIDASDMPESAKQAAKQRNNAKLMPTFALPQSDDFWDNAAEGAGTILGDIGKQVTLGLATGGGSAAAGKVSDTVYNAMKGGKAADTAANAGKAARLWDRVAKGTSRATGTFIDNEIFDAPNTVLTGISKGQDANEIVDQLKNDAVANLIGSVLLSGLPSALSKNPYRYYNGAEVIPTDADVEKWIQDNPKKAMASTDGVEIGRTVSVDPESNLPFDDALRINKTSQQTTAGEVSPKTTFYSKYKSENPMPDGKINGASASDFIDAMEKELPDNVLDLDDKIGEMEAMLEVADDADDVAGGATSYKKQLEARLYAARMKKAYMEAAENTASKSAKSVGNVNADTSVDAAPMSKEEFYNSYNSMARDIPKGKINFGGKTMSVAEYADMVDTNLPDTKPELESRISNLERIKRRISGRGGEARNGVHGSRNAAHQTKSTGSQTLPVNIQLFAEENVSQRYRSRGASQALEIDAQLYAAKRKLTYLELAQGEEGVVPRGFVQSILQKNTPLSTDEILEYLRQNPETYTVKADAVKFANADRLIDTDRKKVDLYNRVVSAKPGTLLLNDEEVEAVKKLAEEYLKQGDTQKSANLIIGLSRTGTEAGRALRSYGFKDLTSPEGVIRAADDAVRQGIDNKAFKGASDALDDFADKVRGKVESGAGKQATGTADRVASVEGAIQDSIDEITDNRLRKLFKKKGNTRSMAERIVEAIDQGAFNNETLKSTFAESLGLPSLDEDTVSKLVELAKRAGEAVDYSQEQADIFEEIYETLAKKVPMTALEKWESWRKTGMLSNIKTHLKNIGANAFMYPIRKIDAGLANILERIIMRGDDAAKRTRSVFWRQSEHGRKIRNIVDSATDRARMEIQNIGKYNTSNNAILRARDTFSSKHMQWFNKLSKANSRLMEAEDMLFFVPAFRDNLGQIMTARGLTEVTDEVYDLAFRRAGEAVFRGKNAISTAISQLKNNAGGLGRTLLDTVIPFTDTPANILISSIQHSPVEAGVVLADIVKKGLGKSGIETAEIIDKAAKSMSGTLLLAAGIYGAASGIITTKFSHSGKRGKAGQIEGNQENALHIGNTSISFDWLQPASTPLIVGARLYELAEGVDSKEFKEKTTFDKITEGASNFASVITGGLNAVFEQSFLQSISDLFASYGDEDQTIENVISTLASSAATQSIPTAVGQLARTVDPIQRKTTGNDITQTFLNQVASRLPGASTMLEPQLDAFGQEVRRSNAESWIENAFNQFVNPSNVSHALYTDDDAVQEMMRVFQATDDTRALPSIVESTEEKPLTVREITEEQKRVGAASKAALDELMNNERRIKLTENYTNAYGKEKQRTYLKYWNEMTDEEKVKVLARIFADAKQDPDKYIDDLMKGVN
jgi:hypothetical protein